MSVFIIMSWLVKYKPFANNIIWSNINQLTISLQYFTLSVVLIRFTSTSFFGEFLFLLSIVSFISVFTLSGTRDAILQAVALNKKQAFVPATKFSYKISCLVVIPLWLISIFLFHLQSREQGIALFIT